MTIREFDALASTNDYCKMHEKEGDMIVIAHRQTAGRGSKNRSFDSGMGGVYLSKLTHYSSFLASEVFLIMVNASVAVCKTMEDFSLTPSIKWPNDVYVNEKKICGILIENSFSGANISRSIVGIGINVCNALPEELLSIATTVSQETGKKADIEEVKKRLIHHLREEFSLSDYVPYLAFLGRKVTLIRGEEQTLVTARGVDEKGRLIVENLDGKIETVTAGEVSLRLKG